MAFIPVPDTVQLESVYEWDGQIVENTFYYRKSGGFTLTDVQALTDEFSAYLQDHLVPTMSNVIKLLRVVATALDVLDGIVYVTTAGLPQNGGVAGNSVPNNVSLCVSLKTARRGRSYRGRNFIPGLPTSVVTNSEVGSSQVTGYESIYNTLISLGGDDGWEGVVVSRFNAGAPRTTGVATPIVNAVINDPVVDSQRRRLPGRGS